MDPAITALVGAAIGAIAGLSGVLLSNWLQVRYQQKQWIKNKKEEAYSNTLRHLFRMTNKRSRILADGTAVLSQEHQKEWFDDYIATVEWLSSLSIFAKKEFDKDIRHLAEKMRIEMEKIISGKSSTDSELFDVTSFMNLAESLEDEIILAAIRDLRLKR